MGLLDLFVQSSAHPNDELTYKWRHGINDSRLQFLQGLEYQDSMTTEIRLLGYRGAIDCTSFWLKECNIDFRTKNLSTFSSQKK